ncbi:unnamed protein product [Heterobilharzia americana]|nr:unnamed protein product [Heterobilharzia americana]
MTADMYFKLKIAHLFRVMYQFVVYRQKSKLIGIIVYLLLFQLIVSYISSVQGIRWLGIYRLPKGADHPVDSTAERFTPAECQKAANELGLRRRQMRFCLDSRFGYAMLAVLRAAHAVGYHCPKTFSDRRWNCTSIHQLPHVSPELKRGTREQAIVHAFASAVLLFEIGRYCALNKIRYCSCGDEDGAYSTPNYPSSHSYTTNNNLPGQQHRQNVYSDFSGALVYNSGGNSLDPTDTSKSGSIPMTDGQPTIENGKKKSVIRTLNRHNYLAGVVLMESNQKLVCKCHGVSGSCAQRVCFRQLRRIDTEVMQKALKMRYLAAKQVSEGMNGDLMAKTFIGNGFIDEVVKPEELVFSEHSPDYCNVEPQRGSVGTRDRICTLKDTGTSNCVNMCCGRGYRNVTKRETIQCNCRMANGFKVHCDECNVETVTQRCL